MVSLMISNVCDLPLYRASTKKHNLDKLWSFCKNSQNKIQKSLHKI